MKKLIAVSAVAALAATALSAEITFGSWGRALWVTAANSGYTETNKDGTTSWKSEIVSDVHQSWGGNAPRTALGVSGNSDNVGFKLDIHGNATGLGQGDNAYIWVKPIEQVKLSVGRMDDTTLRGDACFGLWDWDRIGCVDGQEGWTFGGYFQQKGVNIQATPVDGLTLGAAIPLLLNHNDDSYDESYKCDISKDSPRTLSGIYAHGAAYLGAYTIEGIGTIKAALKTEPDYTKKTESGDEKKSHVKLGAAFDLTAVENLFVTVGAKIDTAEKTAKVVNAYARYNMEAITIHAIVGTKIGGPDFRFKDDALTKDSKEDGAFGITAGVGVDYALEDGIALFADVRYANGIWLNDSSDDHMDSITIGAGVTKGFSNGKIGIAFEGTTNAGAHNFVENGKVGGYKKTYGRYAQEKAESFAWEIPVKFEYWF